MTVPATGDVRDCRHHSPDNRVKPYPPAAGVQLFPPEKENALQAEATVLDQLPEPEPWEIPRLGDTPEFGSLLLRILTLQGWEIDERPAVGEGRLFIAHRQGVVVQMVGGSVADIAVAVFEACTRLQERR